MPDSSEQQELKRTAAVRAAEWIRDGMVLGLGSGSTMKFLLEELAARRTRGECRDVVGIPTSEETAALARRLGLPLGTLAEHPRIDVAVDGADEVDPELRLIKGLGGALLREKIVASAARQLVIIVDATKIVARLGTRSPLPVEVDPFGVPIQPEFLRSLGAEPSLRLREDGSPYVTDGGNHIFHCRFPDGISDPEGLEVRLNNHPGVMENGLFLGMASHVVVARPEGVEVRSRAGAEH